MAVSLKDMLVVADPIGYGRGGEKGYLHKQNEKYNVWRAECLQSPLQAISWNKTPKTVQYKQTGCLVAARRCTMPPFRVQLLAY